MTSPRSAGPLLAALLPPWVGCAESTGAEREDAESEGPEPLFPEEEALIARAGAGRRAEFRAGRRCARHALARLGHPAAPLLRGRRGMPAWPEGVVGSITHRAGYRAAAVARTDDVVAVGIDVEPHAPLSEQAREAVVLGPERDWLAWQSRRRPQIAWDRLLFSAKESVYKAWSGAGGGWLGFEEAELSAEPTGADRGTFLARLCVPQAPETLLPVPRQLDGRWLVRDGLLLTAVLVPAAGPLPTSSRSIRF